MRERFSDYLNEIVSLVIMLLLAIALVTGPRAADQDLGTAASSSKNSKAPVAAQSDRRW